MVLFFTVLVNGQLVLPQLVDNSSSFSHIDARSYLRIHYDNDLFTNTDHYYTQGIAVEWVHPVFQKSLLHKLLLTTKDSSAQYGAGFNLFGYTPTSISNDEILYGDRPFEGNMSLKLFAISTNKKRDLRLASALHLGVIGPAALGEEIQTNIHRWTGNKLPKGWQHQVRNDLILDYQLNTEKKWISSKAFILNGMAAIRAGTLNDKLAAGINFMTGQFNDPFERQQKKKTAFFLFGQSQVNLIGYDATMQGGLFNHKSPYTISSADISRVTIQASAGIVLNIQKLWFRYSQSFITKEFRTGGNHRWGGLAAGLSF
ncbi:MAG TPA: lipid A deacylase LpxR family protein [Chitinophagaceae bacterium]|nr:lipid A deacylase LpxR family protein [Chitinophagaceae bacterium]